MRLQAREQRDIARLHFYDPSQSHRGIARAVGLSPNTVRALRHALVVAGVAWSTLEPLDDDGWSKALGTIDRSIAKRKEAPDWEWVHKEMERADATLEKLWREWKEGQPGGIAYSQFATNYRTWARSLHIVMRRVHRPGEKLFVDFAGRTVEITNQHDGTLSYAQIFIAVLGYSNYTYIKAVPTQATGDWMRCHTDCFEALGGAPAWVVSDNLKSAVWRRERERIVINPAYRECLRHYDTAPLPAGPRKPRQKAKAEVGVQIAQRWVLFSLRDRIFFSIDELNAELLQLTEKLNAHPFKKMKGCRRDRFEDVERATLKPLPGTQFEPCDWRYGVRVGDDHHVEHGRCFYSVPSQLRGERVDLRYTASTVEVMHRGRRVAMHALLSEPGESRTIPEHRPIHHQRVLDGEPKALVSWAHSVGPESSRMISHHLNNRTDATNGLRAARRMRDLARLHGDQRFEQVCAYAMPLNITALRSVESIFKQSADRRPAEDPQDTPRPPHTNVRGGTYYGEQQ